MSNIQCPYCKRNTNFDGHTNIIYEYNCSVCGKFFLYNSGDIIGKENSKKVSSYLFYNQDKKNRFVGTNEEYEKIKNIYPEMNLITMDEIDAFWPRTFSEKITCILLWLETKTSFPGEIVTITHGEFQSLAFMNTNVSEYEIDEQYRFYTNYLYHHKKYFNLITEEKNISLSLTPLGYERIEELQLDKRNNKKVFVSMAFNDNTANTREAIKNGIIEAKYDATLIDEIIHNKQIVPEMFRLIRESRLLVMDISEPNYGAYYEAGYAQGLGKEVIITCSEERFYKKYETDEEEKYEKFLKPHFDIAQKQILLWRDTDDLTKKLSEWIKAIE